MAVMGFSHDPGPLPFATIRDRDKWEPRLTGMKEIDLQCDRGGFKVPARAKVMHIEDYDGPIPPALAGIYRGKRLIAVFLAPIDA
jgi:hypothetical protein